MPFTNDLLGGTRNLHLPSHGDCLAPNRARDSRRAVNFIRLGVSPEMVAATFLDAGCPIGLRATDREREAPVSRDTDAAAIICPRGERCQEAERKRDQEWNG